MEKAEADKAKVVEHAQKDTADAVCGPRRGLNLKQKCPTCEGRLWMQEYYDDVFCDNCGIIGKI